MKLVYISFIQAEKLSFLRTVCRHVANTLCRPDADSLLVRLGARDMSLEASDLSVSTLSRTFASLYKTKQKVDLLFRHGQAQNDPHRLLCPSVGAERLSLLGALVFSKP